MAPVESLITLLKSNFSRRDAFRSISNFKTLQSPLCCWLLELIQGGQQVNPSRVLTWRGDWFQVGFSGKHWCGVTLLPLEGGVKPVPSAGGLQGRPGLHSEFKAPSADSSRAPPSS